MEAYKKRLERMLVGVMKNQIKEADFVNAVRIYGDKYGVDDWLNKVRSKYVDHIAGGMRKKG